MIDQRLQEDLHGQSSGDTHPSEPEGEPRDNTESVLRGKVRQLRAELLEARRAVAELSSEDEWEEFNL